MAIYVGKEEQKELGRLEWKKKKEENRIEWMNKEVGKGWWEIKAKFSHNDIMKNYNKSLIRKRKTVQIWNTNWFQPLEFKVIDSVL